MSALPNSLPAPNGSKINSAKVVLDQAAKSRTAVLWGRTARHADGANNQWPKIGFGSMLIVQARLRRKMSILPNFAIGAIVIRMSTMNISLPDHLKSFVDEQVAGRGYGTSSEYIRELIRRDQDRLMLRGLLIDGASSVQFNPVDGRYFAEWRDRVRGRHSK